MKTPLHLLGAIAATCLPSLNELAASPSTLVNRGFEDVLIPSWGTYPTTLPGWQHYGPNSGGGSYWNVNARNLGGWAEATILTDLAGDWTFLSPSVPPLLEGHVSIGLWAIYPADALMTGPWGWSQYASSRTGDSLYLGRAGISQSVDLPDDITELTCYYADLSFSGPDQGSLVLSFNNQVLGYTLEPTVGPNGPTTLLRADLTPVAGQFGELRLGIEGPGFFIVDNIIIVPEASTLAGGGLVALGVAGLAMRRHRRPPPNIQTASAGGRSHHPSLNPRQP